MTPQRLATLLHSLPPILHITYPRPILSYSKGAQGLFVPLRVIGIFTDTTISPSSWLRQCPDRYTIRAGRNLPDKEFRYLTPRLACVKPAASVHPEPGSNSSSYIFIIYATPIS